MNELVATFKGEGFEDASNLSLDGVLRDACVFCDLAIGPTSGKRESTITQQVAQPSRQAKG